MTFLKNVSYSVISQISCSVIQLLTGIITARYLGPEGRGLYNLYFSNAALFASFAYLGINQSIIYDKNKNNISNSILAGNTLLFIIIASCLIVTITYVFPFNYRKNIVGEVNNNLWLLFPLITIMLVIDMIIQGFLLANKKYNVYFIHLVLQMFIILCVAIPLMIYTFSAVTAIIYRVSVMSILSIIMIGLVAKIIDLENVKFDLGILVNSIRFGSKSYLQNFTNNITIGLSPFIVTTFSTLNEAGIYSIAFIMIYSVRLIPDAVGTILLPKLTSMKENKINFTIINLQIALCITTLIGMIMLILCKYVILFLFGEEYTSATVTARLILLAGISGCIYQILTRFFTSESKQQYSTISSVIGLIAYIVIAINFTSLHGASGTAFGLFIGNILTSICMLFYFKKYNKKSIFSLFKISRSKTVEYYNMINNKSR